MTTTQTQDPHNKRVKISLSFKQALVLKNVLGGEIVGLSESEWKEENDKSKVLDKIDDQITKAINKNGIFFKWQNEAEN